VADDHGLDRGRVIGGDEGQDRRARVEDQGRALARAARVEVPKGL
jgi:hypothetical protein